MALLILHKHAKVRVEDLAEQKHEELLPNTTIILTLFISKYHLGGGGREEGGRGRKGEREEGGRERRREGERERERERERDVTNI